ncbi:YTH domain-containing protein ECT2-like isoform X2 [Zingiber officinale]|uniref:YTH domain-containing protein ECT2-like isoform X2 n=1 Tax=Zingiber officinale TaxID=94328 RepID=UPI001C4D3DE3|nr:YTH domain-containing protein ECT2-like isoform X2 [Zingiber officinale]
MFEYYSPSTILSKILESSSINFDENIWDAKHEVIMVQWHIGRIILDMLTMMEEVPPHGVYGDMYHHGYGYAQYSPYPSPGSPVPTLRHNNQLYTSQHYQFQATYFQPPLPTNAPYTSQNPSSKVNISTSTATDVAPTPIDTTQASSNGIAKESTSNNNRVTKIIQSQHNIASNIGGAFGKSISSGGQSPSGYQDLRYGFDSMWSPISWYDGSIFADGQ